MVIKLENCRLVTDAEILHPGYLIIGDDGYIKEIGTENHQMESQQWHDISPIDQCVNIDMDEKLDQTKQKNKSIKKMNLSGYYLLPGFIDFHTHGLHAYDFMDGDERALRQICHYQLKRGATGFLATTMTDSESAVVAALESAHNHLKKQRKAGQATNLLGINLEGPFISPLKKGIHNERWMVNPSAALLEKYHKLSGHNIKVVSMAPELEGAVEAISWCRQHGIIASAGHTNATYQELCQALRMGLDHGSHLFNAMSPIHHREPGAALALLLHPEATVELICDKEHLHPTMIDLVLKLKPVDKVMLVSDTVRAAGLDDGEYQVGDVMIRLKSGRAETHKGKLAGGVVSLSESLANLIEITGLPLIKAVKTVALTPAKRLGLDHERGSLLPGKRGDAVIMDECFQVKGTIVKGNMYWWE